VNCNIKPEEYFSKPLWTNTNILKKNSGDIVFETYIPTPIYD
jgi:hypothetical protein